MVSTHKFLSLIFVLAIVLLSTSSRTQAQEPAVAADILYEPFLRPLVEFPDGDLVNSKGRTIVKYAVGAGIGYVAGVLMCPFIGGEDNSTCTASILVGVLAGIGIASAL